MVELTADRTDVLAGYWQDLWFEEISDDGVVSGLSSQTKIYASNWIPLWAGLLDPQSAAAVNASRSLAASGQLHKIMICSCSFMQCFSNPRVEPFPDSALMAFGMPQTH